MNYGKKGIRFRSKLIFFQLTRIASLRHQSHARRCLVITNHRLQPNSAKFRGNGRIPRLGWKFPRSQRTVASKFDEEENVYNDPTEQSARRFSLRS